MGGNQIRVGMLGGQEIDLQVLSELHRQDDVHLEFVYDRQEDAVGIEIAEILGIDRFRVPDELAEAPAVDYVVVSEPRARFAEELRVLTDHGAKILTPASALEYLCRPADAQADSASDAGGPPQTIDSTLIAIERLLDRRELLRFLLEVAVRATASQAGSIMLYSPEAKELYIAYATGLSERVIQNTRQKLGEGIAGNVAMTKQAQLIQRPSESSLYKDRDRLAIGSAISVPLLWENRLLGVLNVSRNQDTDDLEPPDLERMKPLSRRLSRVLFESLKIQEVQVRHRETRFRSQMTEIAEKDVNISRKFSMLARYLGELMGADTVDMYVNTQEGDWFVLSGSNRMLTPDSERVRVKRGALSRAFLEDRSIVMTESVDPERGELASVSSVVYCPLSLRSVGGVMTLEFSERHRLDEFLVVREAIVGEVSQFIASELREHRLRKELKAHGKISDAAPALLGCQSLDELSAVLARVALDVLECERVSIRLRAEGEGDFFTSFLSADDADDADWQERDADRFMRWLEKPESVTMAFLDFEPAVRSDSGDYRSMIVSPVRSPNGILGAITGYDKAPADAMDEAIFTHLDEALLHNLTSLIQPVIDAVRHWGSIDLAAHPDAYDDVLVENRERLKRVGIGEIARSDRYHSTFALVLFRVRPLEMLFEQDAEKALAVVDEMTQGMKTRTRKTDFGTWIDRSTYATDHARRWQANPLPGIARSALFAQGSIRRGRHRRRRDRHPGRHRHLPRRLPHHRRASQRGRRRAQAARTRLGSASQFSPEKARKRPQEAVL